MYRGHPLHKAAREKQFRVRQRRRGTQKMKDGGADPTAHHRHLRAVLTRHVATQHRGQCVAVQERA